MWKYVKKLCWLAGGATVAVVGAPYVLTALGFGAGGIVAGSAAAEMMTLAIEYGIAEGAVLALETAGMCGIPALANVVVGGIGAVGGHLASYVISPYTGCKVLVNVVVRAYETGQPVASLLSPNAGRVLNIAAKVM